MFDSELDTSRGTAANDLPDQLYTCEYNNVQSSQLDVALDKNARALAILEQKNSRNQSIDSILQQIQIARSAIVRVALDDNDVVFIDSCTPLHEALYNLKRRLKWEPARIVVVLDNNRRELMQEIFNQQPESEREYKQIESRPVPNMNRDRQRIHTTQIIFDNGDYQSAFDMLAINLSKRNVWPWQCDSVYIQESLKDQFFAWFADKSGFAVRDASTDNAVNQPYRSVVAKTNGKLWQNADRTVCLLIDVPIKHVIDIDGRWTTLTFFRTAKEICHLLNQETCIANTIKYTSIWTENISLLYQTAFMLNTFVIWNNCWGIFDDVVPCPMSINQFELNANDKHDR